MSMNVCRISIDNILSVYLIGCNVIRDNFYISLGIAQWRISESNR